MAQELTLPGPAQLHISFLPSQPPLPECGKTGILKEWESTPSSTAWLFFNSALLTNTAFPNYNSTRKLYSFIKKRKKKPTQIQASQKFSPYKNKHIRKQSQSNQAGVLCPRRTSMQLEAVCQQNRIGFRFWNPRPSLECMHQLCGAGQGGWPLWVMASLTVLNILAHEVTMWMRGYDGCRCSVRCVAPPMSPLGRGHTPGI